MLVRRSLIWLLKQLLPPACPLCRETLPAAWQAPFCRDCLSAVVALPAARCSCCALPFRATENSSHLCGRCLDRHPPFTKVYSVGCYEGKLREAIHQFKFNRQVALDRPLAGLLNEEVSPDQPLDLIVPVPLHRRRLQQRSYNQSLLLARELAHLQKLPVATDLLLKKMATVAQHELSARERERNLRQAFQLKKSLNGERVLLVDDVMTTGSTVKACSQALLDGGANEVQVAVVARA